ncbi:MAG: TetR/AcrR family transcriptional regulator [Eggerthellaceae bacterium]|nr:TetR/AcrR family transcriptional regulator [Eggerthellaceae bacterium]
MTKHIQQTQETKQNLIEAFWSLYETKPLEQISVAEISSKAGYNRGTFYLHFKDLNELRDFSENLLFDKTKQCVGDCMHRLDKGDDPELCLQQMLSFYEQNKRQIVILFGEHGDPRFVERLKEEFKPLWKRYVFHKADGEEVNDLILEYTLSGAMFMVSKWLANPNGISAEKLLHLIYHTALHR